MRISALTGMAAAAAALAVVLSGCGSDAQTATASSPSSSATSKAPKAPEAAGSNPTIADYIRKNDIQETGIKMGDASAPAVNVPVPDGWRLVPPDKAPDYAYGAIVYSGPEFTADPPNVVVLMSKLTGDVDQQKIIDLAPGELKNLPGYRPGADGETSTVSDHPAYALGGTYTREGAPRFIDQKTVVIPAADGLYVLQLNVDGPQAASNVLGAATDKIDSGTTIG